MCVCVVCVRGVWCVCVVCVCVLCVCVLYVYVCGVLCVVSVVFGVCMCGVVCVCGVCMVCVCACVCVCGALVRSKHSSSIFSSLIHKLGRNNYHKICEETFS